MGSRQCILVSVQNPRIQRLMIQIKDRLPLFIQLITELIDIRYFMLNIFKKFVHRRLVSHEFYIVQNRQENLKIKVWESKTAKNGQEVGLSTRPPNLSDRSP